jgi:hypothetical protein
MTFLPFGSFLVRARRGALPEGALFSADGQYLYVGNFIAGDMSVVKVDGTTLTDTGQRIKLPGHPASMRAGPQ